MLVVRTLATNGLSAFAALARPLRPSYRGPCIGRIACNVQALTTHEFITSALVGVLTFAVCVFLARSRAGTGGQQRPSDLFAVVGVVLALFLTGHLLGWELLGLALLVAGGHLAYRREWPAWAHALALVPGAAVLGATPALYPLVPRWADALVAAATVVGGVSWGRIGRLPWLARFSGVLFAVSCLGVYFVVPDTDFALILGGVCVPWGMLSLTRWATPVSGGGAAGLVGALGMTALVGGYGRPSAIVGAVGCLGVLLLAPVTAWATRRVEDAVLRSAGWVMLAVQLVVVWYSARVAGMRSTPADAALYWAAAEVVVAISLGLGVSLCRVDRRSPLRCGTRAD